MPGDVEHLGSGERSAWRGGLDIGALLQGSWYVAGVMVQSLHLTLDTLGSPGRDLIRGMR